MSMQRDQIETYAREIAEQLGESEEGPLRQIELLLEHAGEEFVKSMMEETLKVESGEGLKTEDGKRRRTKGGVFFYITKGKLSTEIRQIIYPNLGQGNKPKQIEWAERLEHLNELAQQEAGKAHSVAITIQGLPMSVKKVDNSVILALSSQPNNQNLAKGIPIPPAQDSPFMVYMGLRQWEAVEESLAKNKNDRLIVEGECCLDSESGTIAVLARTVTTRMTVKSKTREAQPAKPAAQPQEKSKPAGKPAKNNQQAKPQPAPVAQPQPVVAVVEDPIPTTTREKLEQLYSAAETLRDRIQSMESKGQPGVAMTRKLLQSTELQIEALKKQSNK